MQVFMKNAPLFLSDFNETWILLAYFRKIFKYQILRKSNHRKPSLPCGLTYRPKYRQTERHDEAKCRF